MNLFKIMQSIRAMAQAGKIDFPGAVKYLTDLGVEMNGIVHQALKNVFKEGKARDPDFGNVVKKLPIDDQGIPFNLKTLKSTKEKRAQEIMDDMTAIEDPKSLSEADKDIAFIQEGIDDLNKVEREADLVSQKEGIENLFKKKSKTLADELSEAEGVETFETILPTKPLKEPKYGKLDYDRIARLEGVEVEEIRGKSFREIIEYLAAVRDKADGGRVGFQEGGWAEDLTGQGLALYNSMTAGGHSTQTIQDTLTELGYWSPDGAAEGIETITNIQPAIGGGGGGGIGGLDLTYTEGAVPRGPTTDFNINPAAQLTGKGRIDPMGGTYDNLAMMGPMDYKTAGYHMSEIPGQEGYEAPSKYFEEPSLIDKGIGSIKDFFSGLGTPKVQGTLGTRLANAPRLPLPASMASWSLSPFNEKSRNYNPNFVDQLNFLEMQDNLIGIDPNSGLYKYGPESVLSGKNVISMFGTNDYQTMLNNYIQKMNANKRISEAGKAAKTLRAKKELEALLAKQEADKKAAQPKWTPPAHHTEQGGGGYQDKAIRDIKDEGPGVTASSGMHGGRHYNTGGLATMFTRRR